MRDSLPVLVDSHCHLYASDFAADLDAVLGRAREAGVWRLVVPGTDIATSREALRMSERHPEIYCAVGVHPHEADAWDEASRAELAAMSRSSRVVAIGEIGLDYFRDYSARSAQRHAFRAQLELAGELGLPAIVHNREATADVLSDLLDWSKRLPPDLEKRAGVLHAYSADVSSAKMAAEAGYYIGIAGPLTYPRADGLRKVVSELPTDRALIETDAPFLPPQPHRGERNEPAFVRLVAVQLAEICGMDLAEIGLTTTRNASILFGWDNGN
jgi:TatD DNase family protein